MSACTYTFYIVQYSVIQGNFSNETGIMLFNEMRHLSKHVMLGNIIIIKFGFLEHAQLLLLFTYLGFFHELDSHLKRGPLVGIRRHNSVFLTTSHEPGQSATDLVYDHTKTSTVPRSRGIVYILFIYPPAQRS